MNRYNQIIAGVWPRIACFCFLSVFLSMGSGAATAKPPTDQPGWFRDCEMCPDMVRLPDELAGTELSFSVYELTWAQYARAVDAADCPLPHTPWDEQITAISEGMRDHFPMTSLPPDQIGCYLDWVSSVSGYKYRLPTEAEWQAVAQVAYSQSINLDRPKFEPGVSKDPRGPVQRRVVRRVGGQYQPEIGIFDLFGNASEVVSSERTEDMWVIIRGGNDFESDDFDRVIDWARVPAKSSSVSVGFRLVREGK